MCSLFLYMLGRMRDPFHVRASYSSKAVYSVFASAIHDGETTQNRTLIKSYSLSETVYLWSFSDTEFAEFTLPCLQVGQDAIRARK